MNQDFSQNYNMVDLKRRRTLHQESIFHLKRFQFSDLIRFKP